MSLVSTPTIWSSRILSYLDKIFVYGSAFTNRNYEGEIKNAGDSVKILQVGNITVSDYAGIVADAESITDFAQTLTIDQKKHFNFHVDDVDDQFSALLLVDEGSKRAAQAMGQVRDVFVASLLAGVDPENLIGTDEAPITVGFGTGQVKPYDAFLDLTQRLDESDVPGTDRRAVLPPWFIRALKAQFGERGSGLGDTVALNGLIGNLDGVAVFQSNNVPNTAGDKYKCAVGQPHITFADAIVKTETYRPEKKFATGVKGLHVYGAKLTHPKGFAVGTFAKGKLVK